jgi:hypothetical protein
MILTVENTAKRGRPVRIKDAKGDVVDNAIMADTETGECLILSRIVDPHTGNLVRRREVRPAPLTWEYLTGGVR